MGMVIGGVILNFKNRKVIARKIVQLKNITISPLMLDLRGI